MVAQGADGKRRLPSSAFAVSKPAKLMQAVESAKKARTGNGSGGGAGAQAMSQLLAMGFSASQVAAGDFMFPIHFQALLLSTVD